MQVSFLGSGAAGGPVVSVVLVNLNGRDHLGPCLDSILAQTYPRDHWSVILVDNASTDGSIEHLRAEYPWVHVIENSENTGFARAVNQAAAASSADCIALVNNDSRLDPTWLEEMAAKFDPEAGYVAVAGRILDWEGQRNDFAGAILNFHGMGDQIGFGMPADSVAAEDGKDLLLGCGGALLVSREAFLDVGGFDPEYFAYFEDVDLSWRLWLLGYRMRFAADARSFHHHHGTSSRFPVHQRMILFERNALRTMIKNLDDEHLAQFFGPALLLLIDRAVLDIGLRGRANYEIAAPDAAETEVVPRMALSRLFAVSDVVGDLDKLMDERRRIQARRVRSDEELFAMFGRPFRPLARNDESYFEAFETVVRNFGINRALPQRATRVLFIAYDRIGKKMAGPALRCLELAKALSRHTDVQIASPDPIEIDIDPIEAVTFANEGELRLIAEEADVIVISGYTLAKYPCLAKMPGLLVADMNNTWLLENLELLKAEPSHEADAAIFDATAVQSELLQTCDFFICASERQRDYWLGMLTSLGRVDRVVHADDDELRTLIDVVPFGCPNVEPTVPPDDLGVLTGLDSGDKILLWALGGTWDWFDPVTVIDAFACVLDKEPAARLVFAGLELDRPNVPKMRTTELVHRRVAELGLTDRVVFGSWVPYDERILYLQRADVAIMATKDVAEVRFAFRTRLLDHFWARLPTVTTSGDVLADMIAREPAGVVVEPGDVEGLADGVLRLFEDADFHKECAEGAGRLSERFRWSKVIEPLVRVIEEPWRWQNLRQLRPRPGVVTEDVTALLRERRCHIQDLERRLAESNAALVHAQRRLRMLEITGVPQLFRAAKRGRNARRSRP